MRIYYITKLFFLLTWISLRPQKTAAGLAVAECLLKLGLIQQEIEKISENPNCEEMISQKRFIKPIDLQELNRFPEGSLAKVYSEHMLSQNLDPEFYKKLEVNSKETFVMMSLRQTHDLWHVLTGFTTSVPDELGLQAFLMAQVNSPLSPLLIGARLVITSLKNPGEAVEIVSKVSQGWNMGIKSKPLFSLDWDILWEQPLEKLRAEYIGTI